MLIRIAERAFRMAMTVKSVVPPTPDDVLVLREILVELKRRP